MKTAVFLFPTTSRIFESIFHNSGYAIMTTAEFPKPARRIAAARLLKIIQLAHGGDAASQTALGAFYEAGINNPRRAAHWYRKAADQGHSQASARLAIIATTLNGPAECL